MRIAAHTRYNIIRASLLASCCLVAEAAVAQVAQGADDAPATESVESPVIPSNPIASDPIVEAANSAAARGDEIVVSGARQTQRNSIEVKRQASVIVDGIVNEEIGALPDNSVGDTLERITGVTADRFKGNANELSVRGLGPTLSFATFNGREVSTAGPDRSVAFQQFPSELVNGVLVYKSQQANFLDGGVAGIIELRSIKPLDYGRQLISAEVRGSYSPRDDDIIGRSGIGYRANVSYTDQFETALGDIGISIGYQRQDQAAPEDYYNTNSNFVPCTTSPINPTLITGTSAELGAAGTGVNCTNGTEPRPNVGETVGDRYFATQSRVFRANVTEEQRDAVIGAFQWQPTPELDISLDGQYSMRASKEERNVLSITEALRGVDPILIGNGSNGYSDNALISYSGNSNLENQLERRQRDEEYVGGGATITWSRDRMTVSADLSYSGSHRTETQKATRMRSNRRVFYTLDGTDDVVPTVAFDNFDITDHDLFLTTAPNSVYARNRFATDRRDEIKAARLDGTYELDGGFFESVLIGTRYSERHRTNDNAANNDLNTLVPINGRTPAQLIADANANCRAPHPTGSYMDDSSTNIHTWASFDNDCLFRTFTGSDDALPIPGESRDPSDIDVTEKITTAYAMTNFRSDLADTPVSGNLGLRYVRTTIDSIGFRRPIIITIDTAADDYTVASDPNGEVITSTQSGSYQYWLPSANVSFELSDIVQLRLAGYRALSRSGIESFGAGINLDPSAGEDVTNIVFNATTGNPNLKPLRSWNADVSLEFYVNDDTFVSVAGYYKWMKGAVIRAEEPLETIIEAQTITNGGTPVASTYTIFPVAPVNDAETRYLRGFEVQGSHAFTYLPSPLDGFGVQAGYNFADSDFEYPDTSEVAPYIDPADVIGLSRHSANASVYWEKWGLSLRGSYRYRSGYFKPNSGTNRSIQGAGYLNLSANYDLTDNLQLKLQALNVTGERDVMYKGSYDSITEVSASGPVYYAGVRARF